MSQFRLVAIALLITFNSDYLALAADPEEMKLAGEWRQSIPLGGNFQPDPKEPVFVLVGHGARILVSRDDGKSWEQTYFAHPGADHSPWTCWTVAYTEGVFVTSAGWGAKLTTWLASTDTVNWRHLTDGKTQLIRGRENIEMPGTWRLAAGNGIVVSGGYMDLGATTDFGKTWHYFSLRQLPREPERRKLVTHHVTPLYVGGPTDRFLAWGDDRNKETNLFGNLFATDDKGQSWQWIEPTELHQIKEKVTMKSNGKIILLVPQTGTEAWISSDYGNSWEGPFSTGASGRPSLNVIGEEFWLVGKESRATQDGKTWRSLPDNIPGGELVASDKGTLINYNRTRLSLLRSTDGGVSWDEVHSYEKPNEEWGQGIRDGVFGYAAPIP